MRIEIRPFQDTDTDGIRALIIPIQSGEFALPITWEEQPDLHDIPAFYCQGRGNFWVAEADARIIGTVSLVELAENKGALRKMFVAADCRGKKYSVAENLLNALVDHARSNALEQIFLGTTDAYKAAHRFYEKNGFGRIERENLPADFSFMKKDTRFYRRDLD